MAVVLRRGARASDHFGLEDLDDSTRMGDEDGRRLDEQVFALRLTLPDGSSRKVQCDADTNVEQILQAVSSKVSLLPLGHSARRDPSPLVVECAAGRL